MTFAANLPVTCRTCRFMVQVPGQPSDGVCRRYPPQLVPGSFNATSSAFPPVHIDNFGCGEHQPVPPPSAHPVQGN